MAGRADQSIRCRLAIAAVLATAPALAASAWGADPAPKAKKPAKGGKAPVVAASTNLDDAAEARAILKDLRELTGSLPKDASKAGKAESGSIEGLFETLGRPARKVSKTTLDAAAVDALVEKTLAESKTSPAKIMGDEEFVRRITLDVAGKLPTPDQVVQFVRSKDAQKRAKLIDSLLAGPDYARNLARYWRDVIRYRATFEQAGLARYPVLEDWLDEQFSKDTPWDEIATKLITATGRNDENGAVVLSVAHQGMAVELAGEVSRIFLGVQIQCAQCHDHPTDPWKREQFHEFAAFFAGETNRRTAKAMAGQPQPAIEVEFRKAAKYTMPDLKDPQKNIPVNPKFFLAGDRPAPPASLDPQQRHALVASYVTGQDNPWFARSFVNRVWYTLMGEGFYNPVDDLGPARTATAPEVLDALAKAFQDGGYDVKWLYRTVLSTRAYQREFRPSTSASGKVAFAANCPTRLRADQIVDALEQALNLPLDGPAAGRDKKEANAALPAPAKKARGAGQRDRFNTLFGVDPSTPNDEILGTIPQALFLMNSPQINGAIQADRNKVLGEILSSTPNPRAALEMLYLRVLARRPTAKEVEVCDHYLRRVGNPKEGFEDILWSLINSTEFLSRR